MDGMKQVFLKLYDIMSVKITFGTFSFTLFQLQCAFFAITIISYFIWSALDRD